MSGPGTTPSLFDVAKGSPDDFRVDSVSLVGDKKTIDLSKAGWDSYQYSISLDGLSGTVTENYNLDCAGPGSGESDLSCTVLR